VTTPSAPSFEHLPTALGIGTATPRISWTTAADPAWRQEAYEVRIERGGRAGEFRVASPDSVLVPWPDAPLASRESATVSVRVIGEDGIPSAWSAPATVEAGLLEPSDWTASGIGPAWDEDPEEDLRRPPLLRREFAVAGEVARARLYVTAHGLYELELNGRRVGDEALDPGWTEYRERLRYRTHDVTGLLAPGANVLGAWLGDGWWRGRIGFDGGTLNIYGSHLGLLAQLEIEYADGARQLLATDGEWTAHPSPILSSGLYAGETFDLRELPVGWSAPGFDTADWTPVRAEEFDLATLVAPDGPPVRCTQELAPVSVTRTADDALLVDFGQNFAGRLRLRASAGVGQELVVRHAEVLQDGELYVRTLRKAASVDRYLGSDGSIDWEPRFTIHGFRYAEISGYDGDPAGLEIVGRVHHTDLTRTGSLTTSNPELDRLHENVVWSLRSNFVDIPTDCPQRDERLGWTGDIQVFAPTASYLYDVSGFLESWLKDVAVAQQRAGSVPVYVPVVPAIHFPNAIPMAVWGDVAVLTPWTLFERFDDPGLLARQFESARAWVDQVAELAGPTRLWDTGMQLGDWLDPTAPPDRPMEAMTDPYLVATASFAHSATRLGDIAERIGRPDDAHHYRSLAAEVRTAFVARWTDGAGTLRNPTQTGYALGIVFELFGEHAVTAGAALDGLVRAGGNRIGAGFAGVNLLADALTSTGHADTAYALLLETGTPSWLSMVRKGATTIWERWDSLLDDGTVNPGEMTSFNHYALGSIADWMHRTIGGIAPAAPGYRRIRFAPCPGGGLTRAEAEHLSPYGRIASRWTIADGVFMLAVEVPTGATGTVVLPDGTTTAVGPGEHRFTAALPPAD